MIQLEHAYSGIEIQTWDDGAPSNADSTPVGTVYRNGSIESGITVTVSPQGSGRYTASFTTLGTGDGWAETDHVVMRIVATINSVDYPRIKFDSHGMLDATVTSRASQSSVNTIDDLLDIEISAILAAVDTEISALITAIGTPSNLGSGATLAANLVDIESQTDDIGVAGAGLTNLGGMSTTMKGQVQTEAEDAIVAHRLDELLNADSDIDGAAPPTVGSVFHELMSKTVGSFTFDQTTDSNEAIRDRGDAAWITATGFSTLSQADIRSAVGLASANLDAQLTAIDDFLDTEVAAILAAVDTEIAGIVATLGTPAGASISADLLTIDNLVDDLETRLTATRAGYLDNLSAGAVAQASALTTTQSDITAILADTNELQTDWVNGGRLDLLIDAILADTDSLDTTKLTTARVAVLTDWIDGGRLDLILDSRASQVSLDSVDDLVDDLESRIGVPSNLGSGATLAANMADIESQTDDLGAGGAGLTAVPWNPAWDVEVQSEVDDALRVLGLDHLLAAAVTGTDVTDNSIVARLASKSATADWDSFDNATDSMEAIRDRGDAAWLTASGFSTLSQADVRTAVGLASANLDTQLGAIDDFIDTEIASIQSALGSLFTTARPESYRTAGATGSIDQLLYEFAGHLGESLIAGTQKRVNRSDGVTQALTFLLNSAVAPTAITRDS